MADLNTLSQLLNKLNSAVDEAAQERDACIDRGDALQLPGAQQLLDARTNARAHIQALHDAEVEATA